MKKIGLLGWICQLIVIAWAIDWGIYGIFKLDLISKIPGATGVLTIIQIVVGVAGAYLLLDLIVSKTRSS